MTILSSAVESFFIIFSSDFVPEQAFQTLKKMLVEKTLSPLSWCINFPPLKILIDFS
jgi:hypothetical protein